MEALPLGAALVDYAGAGTTGEGSSSSYTARSTSAMHWRTPALGGTPAPVAHDVARTLGGGEGVAAHGSGGAGSEPPEAPFVVDTQDMPASGQAVWTKPWVEMGYFSWCRWPRHTCTGALGTCGRPRRR